MFRAAETVQLDPDWLSFTGCFPDSRVPAAGVRQLHGAIIQGLVPGIAVGDAKRTDRGTP